MASITITKRWLLLPASLAGLLGILIALYRGIAQPQPQNITRPPPVVGKNNTVLFAVNAEHGLSNVHLATIFSLLENHPDVTVHLASWSGIAKKLERISAHARKLTPAARPVAFHELPGPDFSQALQLSVPDLMAPPGLGGIDSIAHDMQLFVAPWSGPDHLRIHEHVRGLIKELDPAVIVLDMYLRPAIDAARADNRLHAILSPNVLLDVFAHEQPSLGAFWKYPTMGSGHGFPVRWREIPSNIYQTARFFYAMSSVPRLREKRNFFKNNGINDDMTFFNFHQPGSSVYISQDTPGVSLPLEVVPPNVTVTGPIAISVASAEQQDPELAAWLSRAPTVLVSLGSFLEYDEDRALAMATALKALLEETDVQVLWKLIKSTDPELADSVWKPLLNGFIDNGRLRVSTWLTVDPMALLETGNIVASVHHGGANCFHEAILAGVPQVILPAWVDLYNYAARVEEIGVGIWGNKKSAPALLVEELTGAFLSVLDGGVDSMFMKSQAEQLSKNIARPGRYVAADEVARLAATGF